MNVIDLMNARLAKSSKPQARDDDFKLGLAVEGGGMRGVVSAGMLTALEHLGYTDAFDAVYGSSAGPSIAPTSWPGNPHMEQVFTITTQIAVPSYPGGALFRSDRLWISSIFCIISSRISRCWIGRPFWDQALDSTYWHRRLTGTQQFHSTHFTTEMESYRP